MKLFRFFILSFLFLVISSLPALSVLCGALLIGTGTSGNICFGDGIGASSCFCGGGCTQSSIEQGNCFDLNGGAGDCVWNLASNLQCNLGNTAVTPEFPLIPGFLTFLSSLGIPYWIFRRKNKQSKVLEKTNKP